MARALAVFGMFTVHLGVASIGLFGLGSTAGQDGAAELFHQLTRGRSSALFAFLAGLSLALASGRMEPLKGPEARPLMKRVAVRAALLVVLGGLVELLGVPIAIILVFYGLFFVLALPFLQLRAGAAAACALAVALLGPQVSYLIRWATPIGDESPDRILGLWPGPVELVFTGSYPALTFMAFVLAGLAVGRLDIQRTAVRIRMALGGGLLALLGYGGSWAALHPLGGIDQLTEDAYRAHYNLEPGAPLWDPAQDEQMRVWVKEEANSIHGEVPVDGVSWLLVANPHTGTTFEIFGAVGTALLVLVACLVLGERLRVILYPLAAVGSMPLTVYVGHLVVYALVGSSPWEGDPWELELYVLGSLAFATLWRLTLGQGPLERMIATISAGVQDTTGRPQRGADPT
jgi:uncharacterized membrane protein YeiB